METQKQENKLQWKAMAGVVHYIHGMHGWQVKLCDPLTTRAIPERFCDEDEMALYQVFSICTFTVVFYILP